MAKHEPNAGGGRGEPQDVRGGEVTGGLGERVNMPPRDPTREEQRQADRDESESVRQGKKVDLTTTIDPRIAGMFTTPGDRLQGLMLQRILLEVGGIKALNETIDALGERSVDWSEVVAGRKLLDYNGLTREEIAKMPGMDEDGLSAIAAAYESRGLKLGSEKDIPPRGRRGARGTVTETGERAPVDGNPQNLAGPVETSGGTGPVFAGHNWRDLAGKSDQELLAIQGISPAAVEHIRQLQKDHEAVQSERARGRNRRA